MAKHSAGPWAVDPKYPLTVRPMRDSADPRNTEKVMVLEEITNLSGGGRHVPAYGNQGSEPFVAMAKAHFGESAIVHPEITYEHAKANARLIAAAPELLHALTWLVNCIDGDDEVSDSQFYDAVDYATGVIAKAKEIS